MLIGNPGVLGNLSLLCGINKLILFHRCERSGGPLVRWRWPLPRTSAAADWRPTGRATGPGPFLRTPPSGEEGSSPNKRVAFKKLWEYLSESSPWVIGGRKGSKGGGGGRWLAVGLDQPKGEGGRPGSLGFPGSPPGGGRFSRGKTLDGNPRAAVAASRVASAMRMGRVWGQGGTVGSSGANPPTKMPAWDKLSEASNHVAPAVNTGVSDPCILLCFTKHRECMGNYTDSD